MRNVRSVGVKALKNSLSRYLRLVKQGETILITERDEVIAELHEPTLRASAHVSQWDAFLHRLAREGSLRKATRKVSSVRSSSKGKPDWPEDLSWKAIYEDARAERF